MDGVSRGSVLIGTSKVVFGLEGANVVSGLRGAEVVSGLEAG